MRKNKKFRELTNLLRMFCKLYDIHMGVDIVNDFDVHMVKYVFVYPGVGIRPLSATWEGCYILVDFNEVESVYDSYWTINDELTELFELNKTRHYLDGFRPHTVIFDEMHEYKEPEFLKKVFNIPPVKEYPSIERVIFNNPATIVFWSDGTKTVVKASGEKFDEEKGLAMAIAKKAMGNNSGYFDEFKKWLPIKDFDLSEYMNEPLMPVEKIVEGINTTYLTAEEMAEKTGQSVDTVRRDCRRGLHPGAEKTNGKWMIPYSGMAK